GEGGGGQDLSGQIAGCLHRGGIVGRESGRLFFWCLIAARLAERQGTADVGRITVDDRGAAHVRMLQRWQGVPVFGAEAIVHLSPSGELVNITDDRLWDIDVDTEPLYSAEEALSLALGAASLIPGELTQTPATTLQILRHEQQDHLVWTVELERIDDAQAPTQPRIFIDARDGQVVWQHERLRAANGNAYYDGNVSFETTRFNGTNFLEDSTRDIGTYTFRNGTRSLYRFQDPDDTWNASGQSAAVQAHWSAIQFFDYMEARFDRYGPDGAGGPGYMDALQGGGKNISMMVHYGRNYNNAFFSGQAFVFGDGDGRTFGSLVAFDVVGHELGHAVTRSTANFIYANQSGSMDESYADLLAALAERDVFGEGTHWYIGEDCFTPGIDGDALRYIFDPATDGRSPDHYTTRYTGRQNNGGVHINAGIPSLAFYLLSEGGEHPRRSEGITVEAIGIETTADIWYDALQHYMTSSTDFAGARVATLRATADRFGEDSDEYASVQNAWAAVGVGAPAPEREEPDEEPEDTDVEDTDVEDTDVEDTDVEDTDVEDTGIEDSGYEDTGTDEEVEDEEEVVEGACGSYAIETEGSLSGAWDADLQPRGYSYTALRGNHSACVEAPEGVEMTLLLIERQGWQWVVVDSAVSSDGLLQLDHDGEMGTYAWLLYSPTAEAPFNYTFHANTP
ncbi:MAG: M4 family metallopeptidase, partial [Myxococcota bacterium]